MSQNFPISFVDKLEVLDYIDSRGHNADFIRIKRQKR